MKDFKPLVPSTASHIPEQTDHAPGISAEPVGAIFGLCASGAYVEEPAPVEPAEVVKSVKPSGGVDYGQGMMGPAG